MFIFSIPTDWEETGGTKQQGRFYSRLYRFIGTYRIEQNTLTIKWDGSTKMDVVR